MANPGQVIGGLSGILGQGAEGAYRGEIESEVLKRQLGGMDLDNQLRVLETLSRQRDLMTPGRPIPLGGGKVMMMGPDGQWRIIDTPPTPMNLAPGHTVWQQGTGTLFTAPPAQEKPVSVAPGAALVNPVTGQRIAEQPARPMTVAPGAALVEPGTGKTLLERSPLYHGSPNNPIINHETLIGPDGKPHRYELRTETDEKGATTTKKMDLGLAEPRAGSAETALDKPLGKDAAHWTNAQGQQPSPLDSMSGATQKGFRPFQGKVPPEVSTRVTIGAIDQVLALAKKVNDKGLLMSGPGIGPYLSAQFQRQIVQRGDPDLDNLISHTSTLVRTARELGDIGFRAQAAIRGTTDLVEQAKTYEGLTNSINQLRNLVTLAAPATIPRTLRVYNTKDKKYQRVTFEPGETLDTLPAYMDPNQ